MPDLYSLIDPAGDYISNFNFMLRVDGAFDVPLKSVRAFTRENEYEFIQEGGLNDYVHIKRKGITKPYTLVCERYIPTQINDPLSNGTELTLPLMLFVGKNVGGKFDASNAGRYYVFTGAVIMSKEYGGLDAEHSGLLTETVTIGYKRMFCITNPRDDSTKPKWEMNEGGDPDSTGNTKQLYSKAGNTPVQNLAPKSTFTNNSMKWEFEFDSKAGNNDLSAVRPEGEKSKQQHIDKRRLYNFEGENNKNYTGNKKSVRSAQNENYSAAILGTNKGINELSKEEMSQKARKFELTDSEHAAGNQMLSSRRNSDETELRQDAMIEKASQWDFDGSKVEGNGKKHMNAVAAAINKDSKKDMEGRATLREFGGIDEPVKDAFAEKSVQWEFADNTKQGNGVVNRDTSRVDETSKDDMARKAATHIKDTLENHGIKGEKPEVRQWEFDEYSKAGKGDSSRNTGGIKELSKGELKSVSKVKRTVEDEGIIGPDPKARKWEFDKYSKAGKGDSSRNTERIKEVTKDKLESASHVKMTVEDYGITGKGIEPRKWEINGDGVSSRNQELTDDPTKETMEANAKAPAAFGKVNNPVKDEFAGKAAHKVKATNPYEPTGKPSVRKPLKFGTVPNPVKDKMAKKAVHHVKRTVADFLMKK